ncbi:MAG: SDR family oxidoreductase [Caldilineaceae bacterium]|nr:SDR family oxidoreductase [Caldilineaceae bacterium]
MTRWTTADMPKQDGRSVVITGTGGLGFQDALALARAGADVIVAGRNPAKGEAALQEIRAAVPNARVQFEEVDLARLASVTALAERLQTKHEKLDLLINNAAVMTPPNRQTTANGFELQLGTNYLGHFALTAQLLPLLQKGNAPRVINLSSVAARDGVIDFANLQAERAYQPRPIYAQSKLASLIFALELQRRSTANGWGITSIAAHPGISRTDLLHNAPGRWSMSGLARTWLWFLFQPAAQGALPTLYAATSPQAKPGAYYGPDRLSETRGYPTLAKVPSQALDTAVAARLWEVSEQLTGVRFASAENPA